MGLLVHYLPRASATPHTFPRTGATYYRLQTPWWVSADARSSTGWTAGFAHFAAFPALPPSCPTSGFGTSSTVRTLPTAHTPRASPTSSTHLLRQRGFYRAATPLPVGHATQLRPRTLSRGNDTRTPPVCRFTVAAIGTCAAVCILLVAFAGYNDCCFYALTLLPFAPVSFLQERLFARISRAFHARGTLWTRWKITPSPAITPYRQPRHLCPTYALHACWRTGWADGRTFTLPPPAIPLPGVSAYLLPRLYLPFYLTLLWCWTTRLLRQ